MQKIVRKPVRKNVMLNRTLTFLILMLFLAGTLGISAREHICSSSKKVTVTLFPELGNQASGCCCTSSFREHEGLAGSDNQRNIGSQECCKTIHLFFKVVFLSPPVQCPVALILNSTTNDVVLIEHPDQELFALIGVPSFYTDTGPPISGRQRVLTWHQVKIPFPHFLIS
jgi:hypothetical protein